VQLVDPDRVCPDVANELAGQPDEHRLQIRYGSEDTWLDEHPIGRDVAHIDTTLVLGVHLEADLLIGLDPSLYDPLPMGISIEFKDNHVKAAQGQEGWHVVERDNLTGRRRPNPRAPQGLETLVLFRPSRLLDYVRLEAAPLSGVRILTGTRRPAASATRSRAGGPAGAGRTLSLARASCSPFDVLGSGWGCAPALASNVALKMRLSWT
jgi:hypothetical protein